MCKVLLNFPTVYRNKQITFLKRLQILKHEWQEKPSWDQANRRQKLGLVWRIRKKISQIIKDYFHLPFFLLIILWPVHGRMNYKDTKPYMSAFLSVDLLTDFAAFCLTPSPPFPMYSIINNNNKNNKNNLFSIQYRQ